MRTFRVLLIGGAAGGILMLTAQLWLTHAFKHVVGPIIVAVLAAILLVVLLFWLIQALTVLKAKSARGFIHAWSLVYLAFVVVVAFGIASVITNVGPGRYVQAHSLQLLPFTASYRGNLLLIAGSNGGLYMFCFVLLFVAIFIGPFVQWAKKRFDRLGNYLTDFEQKSKDKLHSIKAPKVPRAKREPRERRRKRERYADASNDGSGEDEPDEEGLSFLREAGLSGSETDG